MYGFDGRKKKPLLVEQEREHREGRMNEITVKRERERERERERDVQCGFMNTELSRKGGKERI